MFSREFFIFHSGGAGRGERREKTPTDWVSARIGHWRAADSGLVLPRPASASEQFITRHIQSAEQLAGTDHPHKARRSMGPMPALAFCWESRLPGAARPARRPLHLPGGGGGG